MKYIGAIDFIVIVAYLAGIVGVGCYAGLKRCEESGASRYSLASHAFAADYSLAHLTPDLPALMVNFLPRVDTFSSLPVNGRGVCGSARRFFPSSDGAKPKNVLMTTSENAAPLMHSFMQPSRSAIRTGASILFAPRPVKFMRLREWSFLRHFGRAAVKIKRIIRESQSPHRANRQCAASHHTRPSGHGRAGRKWRQRRR